MLDARSEVFVSLPAPLQIPPAAKLEFATKCRNRFLPHHTRAAAVSFIWGPGETINPVYFSWYADYMESYSGPNIGKALMDLLPQMKKGEGFTDEHIEKLENAKAADRDIWAQKIQEGHDLMYGGFDDWFDDWKQEEGNEKSVPSAPVLSPGVFLEQWTHPIKRKDEKKNEVHESKEEIPERFSPELQPGPNSPLSSDIAYESSVTPPAKRRREEEFVSSLLKEDESLLKEDEHSESPVYYDRERSDHFYALAAEFD